MASLKQLKPRMMVYDRWYPFRAGIIKKVTGSSALVQWISGGLVQLQRYDKAHVRFLEIETRKDIGT
jgi:hypothetical protein